MLSDKYSLTFYGLVLSDLFFNSEHPYYEDHIRAEVPVEHWADIDEAGRRNALENDAYDFLARTGEVDHELKRALVKDFFERV
jgi:hypothetical protein